MPSDFYRMKWKDFILMLAGYNESLDNSERITRRSVAMLLEPYAKPGQNIDEKKLWYIRGDDKIKSKMSAEASKWAAQQLADHLRNDFIYVMDKGRIVRQKISDN